MTTLISDWQAMYAARDKLFGNITEPQWRMLVDLRHHDKPLSVTSCCIASGVPATTALRHLNDIAEIGWVQRVEHPEDKRSELVELTAFANETFDRLEGLA